MENIKDILKDKQQLPQPTKYKWQEQALEIISFLKDGNDYKSSIFKACRDNPNLAQRAVNDCKELNKLYAKYFLKIISKKV